MAGVQQETVSEEAEIARPLRTKLTAYPKNPLCNIQESLKELIAENPDVMGRLVIPGLVDEIVVQRNNTYYLTHHYTGAGSDAGAVFIDESCSIRMPPENLLLRGQSDVGGKVFSKLWQYVGGGTSFAASEHLVEKSADHAANTESLCLIPLEFMSQVTQSVANGDATAVGRYIKGVFPPPVFPYLIHFPNPPVLYIH